MTLSGNAVLTRQRLETIPDQDNKVHPANPLKDGRSCAPFGLVLIRRSISSRSGALPSIIGGAPNADSPIRMLVQRNRSKPRLKASLVILLLLSFCSIGCVTAAAIDEGDPVAPKVVDAPNPAPATVNTGGGGDGGSHLKPEAAKSHVEDSSSKDTKKGSKIVVKRAEPAQNHIAVPTTTVAAPTTTVAAPTTTVAAPTTTVAAPATLKPPAEASSSTVGSSTLTTSNETTGWTTSDTGNVTSSNATDSTLSVTTTVVPATTKATVPPAAPQEAAIFTNPTAAPAAKKEQPKPKLNGWIIGLGIAGGIGILLVLITGFCILKKKPKPDPKDVEKQSEASKKDSQVSEAAQSKPAVPEKTPTPDVAAVTASVKPKEPEEPNAEELKVEATPTPSKEATSAPSKEAAKPEHSPKVPEDPKTKGDPEGELYEDKTLEDSKHENAKTAIPRAPTSLMLAQTQYESVESVKLKAPEKKDGSGKTKKKKTDAIDVERTEKAATPIEGSQAGSESA
ncbi:hypothetical protein L596_018233 [Steinernema carpocapsae]|uniref:Uncharacterized protein n=1 Tax=Steinernema carpocapsae TaxID=34508 RepID=A0A4U5N4E4_STECR|nr:hypothetical protein L596_018233 [Steinernema carpocapsae]